MTVKGVIHLQSYTNSENVLAGPYGETCPTSHDANQAMNIKMEEVIDAEEEEDPLPITLQEIKAKTEVSFMSLYVHC
jgi:pimeloyl-CoA synthetase